MRLQKMDIPNKKSRCPKDRCVYNENGYCEDPRTAKGNSDASCFYMSNKALIAMLKKAKEEQEALDAEVNQMLTDALGE